MCRQNKITIIHDRVSGRPQGLRGFVKKETNRKKKRLFSMHRMSRLNLLAGPCNARRIRIIILRPRVTLHRNGNILTNAQSAG